MTPRKPRAAAARTSGYATADDLPGVAQEDVVLSNGSVFLMRGLTVAEVREAIAAADGSDDIDGTAAIVAACTVEPKITAERMAAWLQTAPAGDAKTMTSTAMRLCAMGQDATKSGVSTDRDGSEPSE